MYSAPDELERLALAVQFLTVSRTDPEAYHEQKSEIVHGLRDLARRLDDKPRNKRWFRSEK